MPLPKFRFAKVKRWASKQGVTVTRNMKRIEDRYTVTRTDEHGTLNTYSTLNEVVDAVPNFDK